MPGYNRHFSHYHAIVLPVQHPEFCIKILFMRNRIHDNPVLGNRIEFIEICEETGGTRTVAEVTLRPFDGIPLHYHNEFSEYYEVLEGELHMQIDREIKV